MTGLFSSCARADVVLIPVALFAVIVALGCYGVIAGRDSLVAERKAAASVTAQSTLTSCAEILQQARVLPALQGPHPPPPGEGREDSGFLSAGGGRPRW